MDVCLVGCIQCGKCIKTCPAGAISFQDNKIHIDQPKCLAYGDECGLACVAACPRQILRNLREKQCLLSPIEETEQLNAADKEKSGQKAEDKKPEEKSQLTEK